MTNRNTGRRLLRRAALGVAAALLLGGCSVDDTLRVPDPDVTRPGDLTGPQALPTLLAGAIGDFQVAFSGTGTGALEGLANMTGLFTDEFFFTESFPTRLEVDRRAINANNATMSAIYFTVERARASANRAATSFAMLAPADTGYSESLSLEGYSFLLLAEAYCSGVPVSVFSDAGVLVNGGGTPLTTQQLLDSAIAKFTLARSVAVTAGKTNLDWLARVGQARALLFKGTSNLAAASAILAVAPAVPTTFVYRIFSSDNTARQNNGIWELNWNEKRWTQANSEAGIGLPFRGAAGNCSNADPRTPCHRRGLGFDNGTPLYVTDKYPDRNASVILASGVEARLIEAEAALAAGNDAVYLQTLNDLRATVPGLTPLTDPGTATGRQSLLFRERAFWLYLTNHRLGDLRRMARSVANGGYGFAANTIFPSGLYPGQAGGVYGSDVNFPIPVEENNNPNFHGCLDRNP